MESKSFYCVGIPGPETVYAEDEEGTRLRFDTPEEAEAKAAEIGGEYVVIPFEHREAEEA